MLGCFGLAGALFAFLLLSLREVTAPRSSIAENAHGLRIVSRSGAEATISQLWRRWLVRRTPLVVLFLNSAAQAVVSALTPNWPSAVKEAADQMFGIGVVVGAAAVGWLAFLTLHTRWGLALEDVLSGTALVRSPALSANAAGAIGVIPRGAGIGPRVAAAGVDGGLAICVTILMVLVEAWLPDFTPLAFYQAERLMCEVGAALLVAFVVVEIGWATTPGKWLLGLRIAHESGRPARAPAMFLRALVRRCP